MKELAIEKPNVRQRHCLIFYLTPQSYIIYSLTGVILLDVLWNMTGSKSGETKQSVIQIDSKFKILIRTSVYTWLSRTASMKPL